VFERVGFEREIRDLELPTRRGLAYVLERLTRQRQKAGNREYESEDGVTRKPWNQLSTDDQLMLLFEPGTSYVRLRDIKATVSVSTSGLSIKDMKDDGAADREKALKFAKRFVTPLFKTSLGTKWFADVAGGFGKDPDPKTKVQMPDVYPRVVFLGWATGKTRYGGTVTVALDGKDALDPKKGSRSLVLFDEKGKDWEMFPEFTSRPDIVMLHELVHARRNQIGARTDDQRAEEKVALIEENRYRNQIGEAITDVGDRLKKRQI
jgi:hypothetical protein